MRTVQFLSGTEVGRATEQVSVSECVEAITDGYRQYAEGGMASPRRSLRWSDPSGKLANYMAILPDTGLMGQYVYDTGFGAEDSCFLVVVFDVDSGNPVALLDGKPWNALKTGATGAVGIDQLARPDAAVLGLLGSGTQARAQLRAACTVRNIETVRVYSPTPAHRRRFVRDLQDELSPALSAVSDSRSAVEGADVVVTATRSPTPVFDGSHLSKGAHVTAMGQTDPRKRELDTETVRRATYVPDLADRAWEESGALRIPLEAGEIEEDHVHAELGDVVANPELGRTSPSEVTVFDSGGTGIETVSVAALILDAARDLGLGTPLTVN